PQPTVLPQYNPSEKDIVLFSSRRRHTRFSRDWSSDVCSSDLFHFAIQLKVCVYKRFIGSFIKLKHKGRLIRPIRIIFSSYGIGRSEERRVGKQWTPRGRPWQYQ